MNTCNETEIQQFLEQHPSWSHKDKQLQRNYSFSNFTQAFEFMSQSAVVIEQHDHHPEWCNTYKHVTVALTTHEAGGITTKDLKLAQAMELIALNLD